MKEIKLGNWCIYPEITKDEFANSKKLLFRSQNMKSEFFITASNEDLIFLKFTFRNVLGEDFIVFRCDKSDYKLKQGDIIYFLFEGGSVIKLLLVNKSYSVPILENICQITEPELDILMSKKLLKWKIKSYKELLEISGGFYMNSLGVTSIELQKFIMEMAETYRSTITEFIDGYKPLFERTFQSPNVSGINGNKRDKIPQDIMDAVWRRDEGKCIECGGKENLEFDHIIPISKGGANTYRNIQLLCEKCNRKKSNRIG